MKKIIYKWLGVMFAAILLFAGFGGYTETVLASEEKVWNYEYEDYSVEYTSYSDWGSGCNGALVLTNKTSESIENWEFSFDYDREITDISNAVIVSHDQGHYVIRNAGYNADIAGYMSVHIGFVAGEGKMEDVPKNFSLQLTVVGGENGETDDEVYGEEMTFSDNSNIVTETIVVDEMSYIIWLLNSTDEELLESGYTEEDIYEIRNYDYSEDILSLQGFTHDELSEMGYDDAQIQGIYGYDGEEDAIQYATTFGLSSAELTVTYHVFPLDSKRSVQIFYDASWNTGPFFTFNDYLAIAWIACDENSYPIATNVMLESHTVEYYSDIFNTHYKNGGVEFKKKDTNYRVLKIKMRLDETVEMPGNGDVYETFYARAIKGRIVVKTSADSYNLNNIVVRVGYSHTVFTIGAEPSIEVGESVGLGLSFSFDWKGQELYNEEKNFKYDGTIVY